MKSLTTNYKPWEVTKLFWSDTILLSLPYPPYYSRVEFEFDVYCRKTKAFRAIAPSSVVFQRWLEHFDWTKVKRKKRKVKVETRLPPLSLFSSKHTKVTTMGKTISGSSSSCFLPPLPLHRPKVPPLLKPDGLLIPPKDRCAMGFLSRGTSSLRTQKRKKGHYIGCQQNIKS